MIYYKKEDVHIFLFFIIFAVENKKIVAYGIKKCVFDTHILKFFGKAL